jgi:hypothetical protein
MLLRSDTFRASGVCVSLNSLVGPARLKRGPRSYREARSPMACSRDQVFVWNNQYPEEDLQAYVTNMPAATVVSRNSYGTAAMTSNELTAILAARATSRGVSPGRSLNGQSPHVPLPMFSRSKSLRTPFAFWSSLRRKTTTFADDKGNIPVQVRIASTHSGRRAHSVQDTRNHQRDSERRRH